MKLILMRHGQSGGNVGLKGKDDFDTLTLKGVKQAEETAKALKKKKIKMIYCSPARRCEQTLDEVLKLKEEMVPIFMSQLLRPKTKKEGYHELQKRIKLFLADLECELEEDDEILIISHFLIQKMFIYEITGKTEELDNGAIRELEIKKEKLF